MSFIQKLLNKCPKSHSDGAFKSMPHVNDGVEEISRDEIESAVADAVQELGPLKVWIEPASPHTQAQSLLSRREIQREDLFVVGRRGFGSGRYDYSNPGFQLRDYEPFTVSKRHCSISISDDGVLVEDLESRFGTVVNGVRLGGSEGNSSRVVLRRGEHSLIIGRRNSQNCFRLIVE